MMMIMNIIIINYEVNGVDLRLARCKECVSNINKMSNHECIN